MFGAEIAITSDIFVGGGMFGKGRDHGNAPWEGGCRVEGRAGEKNDVFNAKGAKVRCQGA